MELRAKVKTKLNGHCDQSGRRFLDRSLLDFKTGHFHLLAPTLTLHFDQYFTVFFVAVNFHSRPYNLLFHTVNFTTSWGILHGCPKAFPNTAKSTQNLLTYHIQYIGDEIEIVGYDKTWISLYAVTSPFLFFVLNYSIPGFIIILLAVR